MQTTRTSYLAIKALNGSKNETCILVSFALFEFNIERLRAEKPQREVYSCAFRDITLNTYKITVNPIDGSYAQNTIEPHPSGTLPERDFLPGGATQPEKAERSHFP